MEATDIRTLTSEEIREEVKAIMAEGDRSKLDRVTALAVEMQRRDEPLVDREPTDQPYSIPKPDKISIGFTWDNVGYKERNTAERAFWILARRLRNPSFHETENYYWIKYRG